MLLPYIILTLSLILIAYLSTSIPVIIFTTFTAIFYESIIRILDDNIDQRILAYLFSRFPVTLLNIFGVGAVNGYPGALNKISKQLGQFSVEKKLKILKSSPHTL